MDFLFFIFSGKFRFSQAQVQMQYLWSTAVTERRVQRRHQEKHGTVFLFVSLEKFPFSPARTSAKLVEYIGDGKTFFRKWKAILMLSSRHPTENKIASGSLDNDKTVRLWVQDG
jgi:hypothetical protein